MLLAKGSRSKANPIARRLSWDFIFAAFEQAETAGDVACCGGLQEECNADSEGDHGDGDLCALDPAREEQARYRGGDHTRLPTPADKGNLPARPSSSPVGQ
jgi:hypothetical protein